MKTIKSRITKFLKYGTLLSSFGFIAATLVQIYARFFMESAPSWTEEAARFFFIYAMSFASGLAMKDGSYVHFDVFYNKLKPKQKRFLNVLISFLTVALFLILGFYAIRFVIMGIPEHSPSLGVSMAFAFGSMVVMGVFVSYFAFVELIKKKKN